MPEKRLEKTRALGLPAGYQYERPGPSHVFREHPHDGPHALDRCIYCGVTRSEAEPHGRALFDLIEERIASGKPIDQEYLESPERLGLLHAGRQPMSCRVLR